MEPITRRETLLNQIADNTSGNAGSIDMEPITREEVYLKQIADNTASGGGGGGGGSDLPATPSTDGTYTLQNTVSSGTGALAWGEKGWETTESKTTLTNESVTTALNDFDLYEGSFSYSTPISANDVIITFNGTPYECQRIDSLGAVFYGGFTEEGPDFSVFPFAINSSGSGNYLFTETAGTYTVKIEAISRTATTTAGFDYAVKQVMADSSPFLIIPQQTTWREADSAAKAGKPVFVYTYSGGYDIESTICSGGNPAAVFIDNAKVSDDFSVYYLDIDYSSFDGDLASPAVCRLVATDGVDGILDYDNG